MSSRNVLSLVGRIFNPKHVVVEILPLEISLKNAWKYILGKRKYHAIDLFVLTKGDINHLIQLIYNSFFLLREENKFAFQHNRFSIINSKQKIVMI